MVDGSEFRYCRIEGSNSSGFHLVRSAPLIDHVVFEKNSSNYGGGLRVVIGSSSLEVRNSLFIGNYADIAGGGIYCEGPAGPVMAELVVSGSLFVKNNAGNTGSSCRHNTFGGGIYVKSNATISGCTFNGNQSRSYTIGTAAGRYARGGAVYSENGDVKIIASAFVNNACSMSARSQTPDWSYALGGAVYLQYGTMNMHNSLLADNWLAVSIRNIKYGSALYVNSGECFINNATMAHNSVHVAVHRNVGVVKLLNSILFFNNGSGMQVSNLEDGSISYSDVQNGLEGIGNIYHDPIFTGFYRIVAPFPCIDAGNPGTIYNDVIPLGLSGQRNDMGYTGGPYAGQWNFGACYRDGDGDGYGDPSVHAFLLHGICGG